MSASFWVSLSTIVFLAIVIFKSYKLIVAYFAKQQDDIKKKLAEASEVYEKAQALYGDYVNRIEKLEVEADMILGNAHSDSQKIINGIEQAVAKILEKKNQELSKRIADYEEQVKSKILSKYTDVIIDDLYQKAG